jgi:hypothetical protein
LPIIRNYDGKKDGGEEQHRLGEKLKSCRYRKVMAKQANHITSGLPSFVTLCWIF